jgi:hypothetical protein
MRAQVEGLRSSKIFKWPSSDVPKRDRRDAYATLLCVLPGCGRRGFPGRAWLQLRKLRRWRDHTPDGTPPNVG